MMPMKDRESDGKLLFETTDGFNREVAVPRSVVTPFSHADFSMMDRETAFDMSLRLLSPDGSPLQDLCFNLQGLRLGCEPTLN